MCKIHSWFPKTNTYRVVFRVVFALGKGWGSNGSSHCTGTRVLFLTGMCGGREDSLCNSSIPGHHWQQLGQIPHIREIHGISYGIWKAYRMYFKIRWPDVEFLWLGEKAAIQSLPFHEDIGRSFLPKFQELLRNRSAQKADSCCALSATEIVFRPKHPEKQLLSH